MAVFTEDNKEFQTFIDNTNAIITEVTGHEKKEDISELQRLVSNFKKKTEDFYRTDRMLNIGVIGQVKAGKSTFLNTLLFDGKEVLPKAPTPKTATLTKMEYSDKNIIQIEYYSKEEWEVLEENACVDLEDEIYTSAREIIEMVRRNGVDPVPYLEKGKDILEYESYDALVSGLNNYVGEDGKYTPIVKAVTLYLNKEEFKGLSIVDTPGLNDPIASRTIRTKEFMEVCDVVFFLSPSTGFLDKSDWILLSSQLPQKGVKKLVLIASRYDSGVRDVLRKQEEDDIFGDDENTTDNVPKACRIVKKKLTKRAKAKVEEFVEDLEARESSPELIEVIRQCAKPIMISSLAYNMIGKAESEFTKEEKNMYSAIRQFSTDMDSDLNLLGNFDEVKALFREVVTEKEHIFEAKAKGFIPDAVEELRNLLLSYQDKTNQRIKLLEGNEKEQLLEQKKLIESQMNNIKADIAAVFGELNAKIESEKAVGIRELRDSSKDYLNIRERTGSKTSTGSYTTGHLFWKKTHVYTYEEHYIEPQHHRVFIDKMWQIGQAIHEKKCIEIGYERTKDKKVVKRKVEPQAILFSEFYFYLAANIEGIDKEKAFDVANDAFPTIYRIDRILELQVLDEHFNIPYKDRFEEGEYRKRIQFMYGGKLQRTKFWYKGTSVEAILDRLPTAKILKEENGKFLISAETFGKGIDMWLRSQGDYVEVVKN